MQLFAEPVRLDLALQNPRCQLPQVEGTGQIYKIAHVDSSMAYIGLNVDMTLYDRIMYHTKPYSGCIHFRNALRCHGLAAFTLQLLDRKIPKADVPALEKKRIAEHNTLHPNGYNLTLGGETSPMASEVVRLKSIATKNTPEGKARSSAASKANQARPDVIERKRKGMIEACKHNKQQKSDSAKIAMNRPEVKARHKAACNTTIALQNKSAAMKKSHADPASKARRIAALKEAWVRRKAMYGGTGFKKP
tara:strand:+ start:13670 stop:14416 length:747 start_codon:yes stop_codon:yes gene_type:complete